MAKMISVRQQNKIKEYIMTARGLQVLMFLATGVNKWYFGTWQGAWVFCGLMVALQFGIIAMQTKIRRSRALYLKTYGEAQPKLEKYF